MTKQEKIINRVNLNLYNHNQLIRVEYYSKDLIIMSNGIYLKNKERCRYYKLFHKNIEFWMNNIDNLLLYKNITFKELRSIQASNITKEYIKNNGSTFPSRIGEIPWNKGLTYKSVPCSEEKKLKIGFANSGDKNGMFGKRHTDKTKLNHSKLMKTKILLGEFTPNSNNRRTNFNAILDSNKYRSSWETIFKYFNPTAEYEKLRIPYIDNGKERIYIVDFIDHKNKNIIEIKPTSFCIGSNFLNKMDALLKYATEIGYTAKIIDEYELLKYNFYELDERRFEEKTFLRIKKFYETYKKN